MRPKLSKNLRRTKKLEAHINVIEDEIIRQKAVDAGLSIAEFVRRSVLLKPIPKRLSKVTSSTYLELLRIGNNINQLTRATNIAIKMGVEPPCCTQQLEELKVLLQNVGLQLSQTSRELVNEDEIDEDLDLYWEDL